MNNFKLWVKACEEFKSGIYKLTNNDEDGHGIYMTINEYFPKGCYNTMRNVAYHLWWNGKHEVVNTQSVVELYRVWELRNRKK